MKEYDGNIVWMDPKGLIPYGNNAKAHPKEQLDKIAASISEFGFDQPIVVDAENVIIKGHGRREASLLLKLKSVPVLVRGDLTPEQVKAARLADNKVGESGWIEDILRSEMEALKSAGLNLSVTGFTQFEVDAILGQAQAAVEAALGDMPFDDSAAPEPLPEPEHVGEDDRAGRFIVVYETEEERAEICKRLGVSGEKVVYAAEELGAAERVEEEAA